MLLLSRVSIFRRPGILRPRFALPFSVAARAAHGEKDSRPSSRELGALVAGIVALGGSGLGLWFLPSPSSPLESSVIFADAAASGQSDPEQQFVFEDSIQQKKPRYILGDSYRRRVFFNYEKRIRMQSPPEKSPDGEMFMTPADLMRAVVPVFPPSESDKVREGNLRGEHHRGDLHCAPSTFFMLFDTNNDGLISFPEYIFFVTLLSIPESSFSVAFKMFDIDNSGEIEMEEFKKVMALMRSYNRQGASHRDGLRTGLKVSKSVEDGGLVEYFFGKDGNGCLQHDKFVQFLRDLHDEIVNLEFAHYDYKSRGTISAKDFALSMVASADISSVNKFLDRVDELDNHPHLKDARITLEEFKSFAELRKTLQPLAVAIFSYGRVNGLLTKQDFQRAASHVCGITASDNVVDIIFHVFDANRDGNLSSDEFLGALQRWERDIRPPTAMNTRGLFSCWLSCVKTSSFTKRSL
ncbi:calcium uptake protein, mitochondrial-like isoform X2 [Phoenix dactylifera]|uniref:Calcium uptake protein, mitochondrial-like isoform X2 n=1 Tax=Phoenix dactylifera TaxID=42345 RepID=A0A8B9AGF2_PHODC|nr:calcium uptake protein, mitochondrial-like isoform X2 [Phoenix dactylifera]